MSHRKILVLTALVLLLFGFIVLFERKMPTTSEAVQKKDFVWELPEDQVDSLRLESSGSIVELKKTAPSEWRLLKPEPYPADSAAVGSVESALAKLRRSGESIDARAEDYGLAPPSAKATIGWKDPATPGKHFSRSLELGVDIPGKDETAARVTGTTAVFFVPSSVAAAVRKRHEDLRSKDVFGGTPADVVRVEIERGRGKISLARKGVVWWLNQPVVDLADGDFAQRFVDELTGLKVVEFLKPGERQNLAALGLAPPLYRVTLSDGKTPVTAEFGATRSDGNTVYARRESQVFTVGSTVAEDLSREAVVFREARLVRFDRGAVAGVDASFGPERFAFLKKDGGWTTAGKRVPAPAADDLLTAILNLKSRSFLDDTAVEALKARSGAATVTLRLAGNEVWNLQLFPARETQALVSGRPGAFQLSEDAIAPLQAAFRKAAGQKQETR